ncbi:Osmotically-inducible protein Y [Phycisphaerales bacterium]|nr:Osmotically-inducible protein Y [Phycisphaerales bacterium]
MSLTITRNDSDVQQDVLRELKWDPRVSETEVGVQVNQGVVALTGFVTNYGKRLAAAEAAHRVSGVLDVANDLEVKIPGLGRRTDAEIADSVRSSLRWDVFVPDEKIRTTVSKGWVTLEGEVDRWIQRLDAERTIQRLAGVVGVTNNITVKATLIDPLRVRNAIEGALSRRAEREAHGIVVKVEDGVVRLNGPVRSWGERHAVEQAAGYAQGVRRVDSRLTVDPYL